MKHIYYLSIASMTMVLTLMASCSNDEGVTNPVQEKSEAIRFAINTDFTRGSDITTNNLTSFNVYAYTPSSDGPQVFMNNVTVNKSSNNVWTYSPVQYWPADESVDFYAFSPAQWIGDNNPLLPIPYNALNGFPNTEDIVYAVNLGLKGAVGQPNPQVIFNFRHALSKVTVKMSSTNSNLAVKVSNVALSNIMTKGNFTFPSSSTSGDPNAESVGKWTDQNTTYVYVLHMSQSLSEIITLNSTPTVIATQGLGMGGTLFMLPQPLTWRSNGSGNDTYIAVMCSIYDTKSGTKLWPNENTPKENIVEGSTFGDGLLKFPLSTSKFSEWQPGCHYIYNLVINSNEEMGSIEFGTPTVDTFIDIETNYQ